MLARFSEPATSAAATRLAALSPLDMAATIALDVAAQRTRSFQPHRELMVEGQEINEALLILNGWAASVHVLEDGRRQILHFLLPGDLIGLCGQDRPVATSTVVAITRVDTCLAPPATVSAALARAYTKSHALERAYLLMQITRLGRLNAQERLADLFLELLERLELAGLVTDGSFVMPLTQEVIADAMGLTSVHVNRTLQALRRDGCLIWKGRELGLPDPQNLRRIVARLPVRVTAA